MPSSKPWAAPEHHHRGFEQSQLFKMDIYSFGMLCLWLLFYNTEHSPDRDFAHDVHSDTCQSVLEHSHQLLTTTREFGDVDKALLGKLFDLCLTHDADQRAQTMVPVMALLSPDLSVAFAELLLGRLSNCIAEPQPWNPSMASVPRQSKTKSLHHQFSRSEAKAF